MPQSPGPGLPCLLCSITNRMTAHQKLAFSYATIVAMGGFIFGLDAALISGTVNFIVQEFSLTDLMLGTAVSAPGLGVLVALPFAGYISNRFGRKKALQLVALLFFVSAGASALAPDFWTLVVARFVGGLAFSSIALASMYIGEIAPPKWRGKLVSMTQINIVIGLSAAYFINYLILRATDSGGAWVEVLGISDYTWRWMLGSEIVPTLIWLGLLFIIPESPYWLVYKNRINEAEAGLSKILPSHEITPHLQEMRQGLLMSPPGRSTKAQITELLGRPMRSVFIIAFTIAIAQQATGINAILFYAPTVFEQLGIGTDAAFMQAVWIGLTSILFTILGLLSVDRLGRRPLIMWGMLWIIISLSICSFGFRQARYMLTKQTIAEMTELPQANRLESLIGVVYRSDTAYKQALKETLGEADTQDYSGLLLQKAAKMNVGLILGGILSFIAAFHFSVGPVMWVLFSEIFPISLRGTAIPFFTLLSSLTSYLVQQFFPMQLTLMGSSSIFLFYAAMVGAGLVVLYRYLIETKNMSIEEIQWSLMSSRAPQEPAR